MVVDYAHFKKLGENLVETKRYILSFFSAVNLRYTSLKKTAVKLSIAGIIVATNQSATPYVQNNIVHDDHFDSKEALNDMGKFYYNTGDELPIHDMVVLITGMDMCRYDTLDVVGVVVLHDIVIFNSNYKTLRFQSFLKFSNLSIVKYYCSDYVKLHIAEQGRTTPCIYASVRLESIDSCQEAQHSCCSIRTEQACYGLF